MKSIICKLAVIALIITVLAGAVAYAASAGTSTDPLVTLSYLEKTFMPNLIEQLEPYITQKAGSLESRFSSDVAAFAANLSSKVGNELVTNDLDESASGFVSVELQAGQSYGLSAGAQILLVSGEAGLSDQEALSDTTAGEAAGDALVCHHLYISSAPVQITAKTEAQLLVCHGE